MVLLEPSLTERRRILRELCRSHPQWRLRCGLVGALCLLALGIVAGMGAVLAAHPTSFWDACIFMLAALGVASVPAIGAVSLLNASRYRCGQPYSSRANGTLRLGDDALEYDFWPVGSGDAAAYSMVGPEFPDDARHSFAILREHVGSLRIEGDVCFIAGAGETRRPRAFAEEDGVPARMPCREFSFILAFKHPDPAQAIREWQRTSS